MRCIFFISLILLLPSCLPKADISVKTAAPPIDFDITNLKFENSCLPFISMSDNVLESPPIPGREMQLSFDSDSPSLTITQFDNSCSTVEFPEFTFPIVIEGNYPSPNHSNSFYILFSYYNGPVKTYLQMLAQKENNNLRVFNFLRAYETTSVDNNAFEDNAEAILFNLDPTQHSFLMTPY
jgi:hypothetical protein